MQDIDPTETQEWLEALTDVKVQHGEERVGFLIEALQQAAGMTCTTQATPYLNTIAPSAQPDYPGDKALEQKITALIRWNAVAMVVRAGRANPDLGGHLGTYASACTLYEVGFNHFWHAPTSEHGGDLLFVQGHASPGIYARSFLEGRLTEAQLQNFRQESTGNGLSSYPHPWLMPEYWQFATVSMGLGALQAIYQARFMRYLHARQLADTASRRVWCFCGDGEMDEPESLGCLSVAGREHLDNLVFVINCNLQRLDGPVRGNSKVVQEFEGVFKGAGWHVIKVLWGEDWDPILAADTQGLLARRMAELVDGEYQSFKAKDGAYVREHFFGSSPDLLKLVEHLSDAELADLNRGGHSVDKVYAAYAQAVAHRGQPVVILAKTVKGYGLGTAGEGLNTAHNTKKMTDEQLKAFRDRFNIPVSDAEIGDVPFVALPDGSPEQAYLQAQRQQLGGYLPQRKPRAAEQLEVPALETFASMLQATGDRAISTTMAFVRIITQLCKDKSIGKRVVPIIPDEARTFGMEGLFRQLGIYAHAGQKYTPVDSEQVMYYKEAKDGQLLEEGINEAGAFCSWLAAATAYSVHHTIMIPFYIYYSMFGFQRIGDLAWAAGDMCARGFLLGATAGRTTLNGEGLQHEDGHSHLLASTIPNCVCYDPTFHYEVAVIIQAGLERMIARQENVFYYLTLMNQNYAHPEMPSDAREGILKGLYCLQPATTGGEHVVQLMGSGTILLEVIEAAKLLKQDCNIDAQIWSATSFNELARDGHACARWNRYHPNDPAKIGYLAACLQEAVGPVIVATDYIRAYPEQVRQFIDRPFTVLGTDGFGRSDSRAKLREFFEVNRYHIVVAALSTLMQQGQVPAEKVQEAITRYQLDPEKTNPMDC